MAVTQNTYTGDGTTVLFSFTFPYLDEADIKVSLNGTPTTAYTLANATTIQFNSAPANGAAIRIYRQTNDAALAATFYPGSAIRSQDLNENFTQNLYVTQEIANYSVQDIGNVTLTANYTFSAPASGPTPTSSSHYATKGYVDSIALSGTVPDGNRGDLTVSGNGTVWTLNQTYLTSSAAASTYQTQAGMSSYLTTSSAASTYAPLASPTFTGQPYVNGSYRSNIVGVSALDIDCSAGNYFTKTITGNSTFTVSSVPSSRAYSFTLELTHTSGTITWFSGVTWPGGVAPVLTTGKVHLFMFVTDDGGTTWRASSLINY